MEEEIERLRSEFVTCKRELQEYRDKEMNEILRQERIVCAKTHCRYDCCMELFNETYYNKETNPLHGSCSLCDEKMVNDCLDGEKIKEEIVDYLTSIDGVDRIEIGVAKMNYGGHDKRKYLVVYLHNGVRSKFVGEEIERFRYNYLRPYITYEWND